MTETSRLPARLLDARSRVAVYVLILVAVGSWTCFHQLNRGMLTVDEAWFAYSTEHMLRTGDYVVPSIGNKVPHLNAAPLYNWLCCLTADVFGDGLLRYRAWGGAFGIGCALAALALGAVLFGPEAGLLAGVLVLTNHHFLFISGIREGRMDPPLAMFITLAVACHAKTREAAGRGLWWWAGTGLCLGLAALMKPPAFAGFFYLALAGHHLFTRRELAWRARVAGPAVAAVVAGVLSLPWYVAISFRLGLPALKALLVFNSVGRATLTYGGRPTEPWWYYFDWIWQSSYAFKLAGPALLWGGYCAFRGNRRVAWGLLAFLAVAFLGSLSAAVTRHLQYVYPAYPLVAVVTAGFLLAGLYPPRTYQRAFGRCVCRLVAVIGLTGSVALVWLDVREVQEAWRSPRWEYPALVVHRAAEGEFAAGRAYLVLYAYPRPGEPLLCLGRHFSPAERIYFLKMPHAVIVRSAGELNQLLAEGRPTIVFLHHQMSAGDLIAEGVTAVPQICLEAPSGNGFGYPLVLFNDASVLPGFRERAGELASRLLPSPQPAPPAAPPAPDTRGRR